VLTDRRLIVVTGRRVALSVAIAALRRIVFDIERARPATLVIVPEDLGSEPQVLAIPVGEYGHAAEVLALLGAWLADTS